MKYEKFDILKKAKYSIIPNNRELYIVYVECDANDAQFYMERTSPSCDNKVPHEGIVIKIENMKSEAFKLKCFKFLDKEGKELDKGESNIEDEN